MNAEDFAARRARRKKNKEAGASENSGKKDKYARLRDRFLSNTDRINAYKVERGCADCGYKGHPCALDFDHVDDDEKVANVSQLRMYSWPAIELEIAKCVVVCANCHRIRTHNRKQWLKRFGGYE